MGFLGKKRKRGEEELDATTAAIGATVGRWRDDTGMPFSIKIGRVVGHDWANVEITGLDRVRVADVLKLKKITKVVNLVAYMGKVKGGNLTPTLVLRVADRSAEERPAKASTKLAPDLTALAFESQLSRECSASMCGRINEVVRPLRKRLASCELASTSAAVSARPLPGVVHVTVDGLDAVDEKALEVARGGDDYESFLDFTKGQLKFFFYGPSRRAEM